MKEKDMNVYGFDNHDGDLGVIIANNYDEAVMVYKEKYKREIVEMETEYRNGGCYLIELGPVKENSVYVNYNR